MVWTHHYPLETPTYLLPRSLWIPSCLTSLYFVVSAPTCGLFCECLLVSWIPNCGIPYRRIFVTSLPLCLVQLNSSLHPVLTLFFSPPPGNPIYILIYVVHCLSPWDMCNADYCKATPYKYNLFFQTFLIYLAANAHFWQFFILHV